MRYRPIQKVSTIVVIEDLVYRIILYCKNEGVVLRLTRVLTKSIIPVLFWLLECYIGKQVWSLSNCYYEVFGKVCLLSKRFMCSGTEGFEETIYNPEESENSRNKVSSDCPQEKSSV